MLLGLQDKDGRCGAIILRSRRLHEKFSRLAAKRSSSSDTPITFLASGSGDRPH
jgi:hypothetical protein